MLVTCYHLVFGLVLELSNDFLSGGSGCFSYAGL